MGLTSWYAERVVPRLVDVVLSDASAASWRADVCAGVAGTVLELGVGSGRNLAWYPDPVRRVLAVEPSDLAWERAGARVATFERGSVRSVERVGLDGARLVGVADGSVDAVVSTWTLCTIPDLDAALAEVRRVLRPGAALHFAEHTVPGSPLLAAAGRQAQPLWGAVSGGCHLDRDVEAVLAHAAYDVEVTRAQGWFRAGVARPR